MREIKFRVWDLLENKYYFWDEIWYSSALLQANVVNGIGQETWISFFGMATKNPNMICQQFTGLKDKNEKDIFEGDILKYSGHVFTKETEVKEIKFKDGCFCVGFIPLFNLYKNNIEIIGNIYQNPELLSSSTIGNAEST